MKRLEQKTMNTQIISIIHTQIKNNRNRPPPYKKICDSLNQKHLTTSRGNNWTPKRLFRMLQRNGYSGLNGLCAQIKDHNGVSRL